MYLSICKSVSLLNSSCCLINNSLTHAHTPERIEDCVVASGQVSAGYLVPKASLTAIKGAALSWFRDLDPFPQLDPSWIWFSSSRWGGSQEGLPNSFEVHSSFAFHLPIHTFTPLDIPVDCEDGARTSSTPVSTVHRDVKQGKCAGRWNP